jgi:hypothetical protein
MNYKFCFFPLLLSMAMIDPSPKKHPKKNPTGQMTGHVHDPSDKPLPQAILKLWDCDASVENCQGKPISVARSLEDGSFVLDARNLKRGIYTLEAALPPFYLSKAKVPVLVPQDFGKSFDFVMQQDTRDAAGNLVGVSAEDAKEIYAAARIEKNAQIEALSAKILNGRQQLPSGPSKKEEAPEVAQKPPSGGENQQASASSSGSASSSDGYSSASSSPADTLEGCLSGSAGNFTLTDQSGKTYQLAGDTSKLSDHVGHQVRITGSEGSGAGESASSSTNPSSSSSSASSGSSSSSSMDSSSASQSFNVKKIKMISSSCSSHDIRD